MTVRKFLFKLHYWLALSACIPLLLIVLSGMLLVFKQPVDALLMPQIAALPYQADGQVPARQNLNQLMAMVNQQLPDYELGSWELFDDGAEADRVYVIAHGTADWFKVYLDPYAGTLLSKPQTMTHYLTDWLLRLHYTLLLDDVFAAAPQLGLMTGLFCAVILSVIGITGLIIYRRFWRHFFTFNWRGNATVVTRRLHRFIGIWSAPVLLLAGLTGIYFNVMEYLQEAQEQQHEEHRITARLYNEQLDFQSLLADSRSALSGFEPQYLLFPYEPGLAITLYGKVPDNNPFASVYGSTVTYDARSGERIQAADIHDISLLYRLADSLRSIHYGDFAANSSRVVWSVSAAGMGFLIFSGVFMYLSRRLKHQTLAKRSASPNQR